MQSEDVNTSNKHRTRWERIYFDPKNILLPVPIRRCQDANTIARYSLSKSFVIKFAFNSILKYWFNCYGNFLVIFLWLTEYKYGCYLLDRRAVLSRECQPDGTINSAMKQDQSKPRRSKVRINVSLLLPFCLSVKLWSICNSFMNICWIFWNIVTKGNRNRNNISN